MTFAPRMASCVASRLPMPRVPPVIRMCRPTSDRSAKGVLGAPAPVVAVVVPAAATAAASPAPVFASSAMVWCCIWRCVWV